MRFIAHLFVGRLHFHLGDSVDLINGLVIGDAVLIVGEVVVSLLR